VPHPPSLAALFIYSSHEGVSLPWLQDSCCYRLSHLQGCWAGAAPPAFSSQLVYLQFECGVPLPPLSSGCLTLFATVFLFFVSCLFIIQFGFFSLFFPWAVVSLSRGYADLFQGCLWEFRMLLTSPGGLLLTSRIGAGVWWCGSSPGFSVYLGVGMLCTGWVWRCQSFLSSWWFFLQGVSPVSLQDFTLGSTRSASSL
jgi:hypothetical protein